MDRGHRNAKRVCTIALKWSFHENSALQGAGHVVVHPPVSSKDEEIAALSLVSLAMALIGVG